MISVLSTVLTLYILWVGYIVRIRAVYDSTLPDKLKSQFTASLKSPRLFKTKSQIRNQVPEFFEVLAEAKSSERLVSLDQIVTASTKSKRKAKLLTSSYQYNDSFLASMSDTAFSISYGVSQVVAFRWLDQNASIGSGSGIDFGQITPIFLLVLPILVAAEIYYGTTSFSPVARYREWTNYQKNSKTIMGLHRHLRKDHPLSRLINTRVPLRLQAL